MSCFSTMITSCLELACLGSSFFALRTMLLLLGFQSGGLTRRQVLVDFPEAVARFAQFVVEELDRSYLAGNTVFDLLLPSEYDMLRPGLVAPTALRSPRIPLPLSPFVYENDTRMASVSPLATGDNPRPWSTVLQRASAAGPSNTTSARSPLAVHFSTASPLVISFPNAPRTSTTLPLPLSPKESPAALFTSFKESPVSPKEPLVAPTITLARNGRTTYNPPPRRPHFSHLATCDVPPRQVSLCAAPSSEGLPSRRGGKKRSREVDESSGNASTSIDKDDSSSRKESTTTTTSPSRSLPLSPIVPTTRKRPLKIDTSAPSNPHPANRRRCSPPSHQFTVEPERRSRPGTSPPLKRFTPSFPPPRSLRSPTPPLLPLHYVDPLPPISSVSVEYDPELNAWLDNLFQPPPNPFSVPPPLPSPEFSSKQRVSYSLVDLSPSPILSPSPVPMLSPSPAPILPPLPSIIDPLLSPRSNWIESVDVEMEDVERHSVIFQHAKGAHVLAGSAPSEVGIVPRGVVRWKPYSRPVAKRRED